MRSGIHSNATHKNKARSVKSKFENYKVEDYLDYESSISFFLGVITHQVVLSTTDKFNVTVRATNEHNLFRETWALITVSGNSPQLFYQYDMHVTEESTTNSFQSPGLMRQISMVDVLNNYFTYPIVNIVHYQDMTNNQFNLVWSVCPLPDKCTSEGLTDSKQKLIESGQPTSQLINLLKPDYRLDSIQTKISASCTGPLNPPTASQDPLTVELPSCGGFVYTFPATLFNDIEDGDLRNLKLYVETLTGGHKVMPF